MSLSVQEPDDSADEIPVVQADKSKRLKPAVRQVPNPPIVDSSDAEPSAPVATKTNQIAKALVAENTLINSAEQLNQAADPRVIEGRSTSDRRL